MKNFYKILIVSIVMFPAALASCKKHVSQSPGNADAFSVSPAGNLLLSNEEQELALTFTSQSAWNFTSNQTWISADSYSGAAGKSVKVTFDIDANNNVNSRSAVLTFKDSGSGADMKKIYVSQLGTSGDPALKWIYDELKTYYYWNKSVQNASPPNPDLDYDVFFENLLTNLRDAKDDDGTMDGHGTGKDRYIYSYVSRTPAGTRAVDEDAKEETFGFGFWASYVSNSNEINAIVTWVRPGSPADGKLKRGMIIDRYQGEVIEYDDYAKLFDQVYYLEGGKTMTLGIAGESQPVTLTSDYVEMTPILYSDVIESPVLKKKVAYLVYNEFETGPEVGRNAYKFDNYLRDAFAGFAADGAEELVLDLRYNLGGYVSSCQVLTSLISYPAGNDRTFAYLTYNTDLQQENQHLNFLSEANRIKGISRVYVLATGNSASASEMVVNALRGIDFPVILIGEQTNGKNVGMNLFEETIGTYDYEMWPITFKISNAKRFSDYANGFTPDHKVTDISGFTIPVYELGNPQEALLKRALALIDGTPKAAFADDTRAADKPAGLPYPRPLPGGGAKIPHPPGAETDSGADQ